MRRFTIVKIVWLLGGFFIAAGLTVLEASTLVDPSEFQSHMREVFAKSGPFDESEIAGSLFSGVQLDQWREKWEGALPDLFLVECMIRSGTDDWYLFRDERRAVQKIKTQLPSLIVRSDQWVKNFRVLKGARERVVGSTKPDQFLEKLLDLTPIQILLIFQEVAEISVRQFLVLAKQGSQGSQDGQECEKAIDLAWEIEKNPQVQSELLHAAKALSLLCRWLQNMTNQARSVLEDLKGLQKLLVEGESAVLQVEKDRQQQLCDEVIARTEIDTRKKEISQTVQLLNELKELKKEETTEEEVLLALRREAELIAVIENAKNEITRLEEKIAKAGLAVRDRLSELEKSRLVYQQDYERILNKDPRVSETLKKIKKTNARRTELQVIEEALFQMGQSQLERLEKRALQARQLQNPVMQKARDAFVLTVSFLGGLFWYDSP
jgi:hypothetical protein